MLVFTAGHPIGAGKVIKIRENRAQILTNNFKLLIDSPEGEPPTLYIFDVNNRVIKLVKNKKAENYEIVVTSEEVEDDGVEIVSVIDEDGDGIPEKVVKQKGKKMKLYEVKTAYKEVKLKREE